MEEKTPTMPCVMFLKYLKITGTGEDSQGKFEYSECKEVKKETCPHCGGEEVYAHGYYHRKVSAMGKDGARKRLKIKVKARSLIQRCGYGYRNFQNYRLRVLIECGRILV